MGNLKKKRRLKMNQHKRRKRLRRAVVRFNLPQQGEVQVLLTDQFGREVQVLTTRYSNSGLYEMVLDVSRLATGVYVVKTFLNGEELMTEKILVN